VRRERASESRNERSELKDLFYCRKERKRYANLHRLICKLRVIHKPRVIQLELRDVCRMWFKACCIKLATRKVYILWKWSRELNVASREVDYNGGY